MALIIQKFGGTSVGSLDRIRHVADKVMETRAQGHDVVVVVSAMSGETNRLYALADSLVKDPEPRENAVMTATGEMVSMALVAMCLIEKGCPARSYTGGQAQIFTEAHHTKARIERIEPHVLRQALKDGITPVVAGFQGIDAQGDFTTLGRGGSDTTAVAIAAAMKADECQIYTDVEGVYTADPRVVPEARQLSHITFEEMLELASLGAKVLQKRAVELVGKYKVPLRVLSSFTDGPGTLITYEVSDMEQPVVSGIAFNRNEAKISILSVPDRPGVACAILGPIGEASIDVDMIVQNISINGKTDFTFTVSREDYGKAFGILQVIAKDLDAGEIQGDQKIAKISLVGVGMRSHSGVAQKMFEILGKEGINIQLITTSEIKISVLIEEKYLELAVRSLHTAFGLDEQAEEEFDPKSAKLQIREV